MKKDGKVIFKKKIFKSGGSLALTIPKHVVNYLDLDEGVEVGIVADEGKHGKYIGLWNIKQQEKEE